jgi:hypothetical protein
MRALLALIAFPLLASALACSAAPSGDAGEELARTSSRATSGGCSAEREAILASTSPARRHVIERGFTWLDDEVPYSQSAEHEGYRTDCSGFVSMCWELGQSYTTADFSGGGGESTELESYDALLRGDALVHRSGGSGHIVLFLGWDDDAHSGACVLEQASTASDMQFRVRSSASLESGGYKPICVDALANDDGAPPKATTSTQPTGPVPDTTDEATPSGDTETKTRTPDPQTTCIPGTREERCALAKADGAECGSVSDGCGGEVSCKGILDCADGDSCGAKEENRCGKKASTAAVKPASDSGDDDDKDTSSKKEQPDKTPAKAKAAASGGCSAAPSNGGSGAGALLLGALALACVRRRATRVIQL